jgi:hypothetical protein
MRIARRSVVALLLAIALVGCGSSKAIKAKGRLVKNGQPYIVGEKESLRIFFAPDDQPDASYDSYSAQYDRSDGTFQVTGKDGVGLPPGNYRISLELRLNRDDQFKGEFYGKKSPLTCTIDSSNRDIVIDLDQKKAYPAGSH